MLSWTLHAACTGINWCLEAPAGGCFLADWLLTTSQARQILRGHIIWRPLSLADNSIVEPRQGGKDQPCYASSLAGVSHPTVGMREGSSSAAARLYLPVSLGMADNSAETTQKLPGKRYLNSLSLSKKERKLAWGRRASSLPPLLWAWLQHAVGVMKGLCSPQRNINLACPLWKPPLWYFDFCSADCLFWFEWSLNVYHSVINIRTLTKRLWFLYLVLDIILKIETHLYKLRIIYTVTL